MARVTQKQVKLGEQLLVSFTGGKKGTFELVDGFFNNRREAEEYRERNYPACQWRIRGLRMATEHAFSGEKQDSQFQHRKAA